jgi:hypothetical protein
MGVLNRTPGRRVPVSPHQLRPGEYCKFTNDVWYCRPPWEHGIGCLSNHKVTEHEDGTITVSPSILITAGPEDARVSWHGYLERGVWREC